ADVLTVVGDPSDADLSAKARAGFQAARLSLEPGVDLPGEVVLLVDDRWQTGWTATIAGALLRQAGAAAVLPMVLHQQP
ncbi:MAG: ATP-dependent helicase RecQ, partial [Actinomycetota bacterium]|nr:ATP-dependent helicase RecQ [Actinomycetota bacterium]